MATATGDSMTQYHYATAALMRLMKSTLWALMEILLSIGLILSIIALIAYHKIRDVLT